MIKKIALATTLLATLVHAEIDQKGFFVGIDGSTQKTNLKYDNNGFGTAFTVRPYSVESTQTALSYKLGYQYYFTRLYARVNDFKYEDSKKGKYTIKGTTYELNADYIPVFYTSENKEWAIRGVFGLGVGYSSSKLKNYNVDLLPVGVGADTAQNYMEYGYQAGVMGESFFGLSLELGLRFRQGNVLEFTDGQNEVTFFRDATEYYFGINYLF